MVCQCNCICPNDAVHLSGTMYVCDECLDYMVDENGEVHCANDPMVEEVIETCGAGGQTRSYLRLKK